MKKLLIGLVCFPLVSFATEGNLTVLDTMEKASFFKDTEIQVKLRNHWKYLKENASDEKIVHNAWGQSLSFNYKSGYLFDLIGFDATYTSAIKLGASDYFSTRGLLYNDGDGFNKNNAKGFNKFNERYVKFKIGDEKFGAKAKVGYQALKNYGILTRSTRLADNSYLSYSSTFNYKNLTWDNAYVMKSINRESPNIVHFKTLDNKDINHISTTGITYKDKNLLISYALGVADNYLRGHIIETSYKPTKKLTLSTQIYGNQALDGYKEMLNNKKTFDSNSAWHYAGDVKWQEKDWSVKFGVAYTKAELKDKIGYYNRHIAKNVRGRFNAMTSAGADYMRDGELALTLLGSYNFIPDVITSLQINYGQFDYKSATIRSGEVGVTNIWTPSKDSKLKNLSVFTLVGYGFGYKNNKNTPILDRNGKSQYSPSLSGEAVIEYRFNLL